MTNILWILLFIFPLASFGDSKTLKFAEELMSEADYFRALTVLKEYEFTHRNTPEGFSAQKKIISLHFRSDDFEALDVNVKKLLTLYGGFFQADPQELKSEVSFFLKNYDVAFQELMKTPGNLEKKYLYRAFTDRRGELPDCQTQLCTEIKLIEKSQQDLVKSPGIALGLGIIPGLGQIYSGHIASGITTFILTGFFTATTIVAFNNNEDAFGIASATVGSVFYFSSIYAGYETARLRNEAHLMTQHKKLKGLPLSFKLIDLVF